MGNEAWTQEADSCATHGASCHEAESTPVICLDALTAPCGRDTTLNCPTGTWRPNETIGKVLHSGVNAKPVPLGRGRPLRAVGVAHVEDETVGVEWWRAGRPAHLEEVPREFPAAIDAGVRGDRRHVGELLVDRSFGGKAPIDA